MILSDKTIRKYIVDGQLVRSALCEQSIQPASLDVRIGNSFSFPCELETKGILSLQSEIRYSTVTQDSYLLMPGQFVLATTIEYICLPNNITAFVEGRSSIGRLGLFIQNAGWVDPGFEGQITLELFNASRYAIMIEAGARICQLVFAQMDDESENPYSGKYQKQTGATGSRIHMDYNKQ